jgi:flagellar L-ring protein precursor FlgH
MKALILCILSLALLAGCDTMPKRDPDFSPVQPADLRPPPANSGAIFQSGYDMRLFEDHAARRVGDVLTITLNERTNAIKRAELGTQKDTSISVEAPYLMGMNPATVLGRDIKTEVATKQSFDGQGDALQFNQLTGSISVTVVEVLPNGNLKVRGEKRVALNDGSEYIRLAGIVRPIDIDVANIVPSSKVADATIMYTGDGAMAESSKMGWITRFFNSPIFPF